MKFRAWNLGKMRANLLQGLVMGRTFLLMSAMSIVFFVLLGTVGIAEKHLHTSPVSSMKGLAASMSSKFFIQMLGMELPHSVGDSGSAAISADQVSRFVFQLLTDVNPSDPKSLVAREGPGLGADNPVLLRIGSGNKTVQAPEDYHPGSGAADTAPEHAEPDSGSADPEQNDSLPPTEADGEGKDQTPSQPNQRPIDQPGYKNVVMIYHSHPQESYNPILGTNVDNPSSAEEKKNVGLVGEFMAEELERLGIATLHSFTNYADTVSNYNYNYSYKYSRETVKTAMAQNEMLQYFIDIHRDSQRHDKTTTTIDGLSYAQVYFIIGHGNEHWRKNEFFANKIHDRLEAAYPGISRGIWGKTSSQGNGEYNQSLSPQSILIEVGGVDNTEEELQRTAKVLAKILSDLYWENQEALRAGSLTQRDTNANGSGNQAQNNRHS